MGTHKRKRGSQGLETFFPPRAKGSTVAMESLDSPGRVLVVAVDVHCISASECHQMVRNRNSRKRLMDCASMYDVAACGDVVDGISNMEDRVEPAHESGGTQQLSRAVQPRRNLR